MVAGQIGRASWADLEGMSLITAERRRRLGPAGSRHPASFWAMGRSGSVGGTRMGYRSLGAISQPPVAVRGPARVEADRPWTRALLRQQLLFREAEVTEREVLLRSMKAGRHGGGL
ncbi:hypothetical protein NDU88_007470 [Pleurodeles waltl]|uniref:Uncharacterized protein n=1 Tax=Pleurodeles waltl TaxID=8319 RepID=A0AAV7RT52_PLEWA|nr:hypothetical protein NDU88_007470 [Pleurodeles waltl]